MENPHRSTIVDIELRLLGITNKAIRVTDKDKGEGPDDTPGVWLPLSQIEYETIGPAIISVSIPEWLAIEKGLV